MKVYKLNIGTKHQIATDPWNTFVSGAFNGTFKGTAVEVDGYIRLNPVATPIDNSISASYIYVSGSTNDLYFSQNGDGYANTTRLRWIEGNLYTGLLNGGIITATVGTNTYQINSGSGIIVNLNTSYNNSPYPTIQYLSWGKLTKTIDALSASYDQQFVAIDNTANIFAQGTPYSDGDYNTKIPIGIVIHQNHSTINAVQTFPSVGYGWKQRSYDFIKAFGPLKISGYTLAQSGSSTNGLVLSGGTAWVDGRNYIVDPTNPSYIVEATGITTSKIYRYYQSGSNYQSNWGYDTNTGVGYTAIDPTQYSNAGTLTALANNNKWSIQRVYYFPNSTTKAFYIYYGNAQYDAKADAIAALTTETFNEAPNTAANAIFVGYMILQKTADFTSAGTYEFRPAGLFRASGIGGSSNGGGGSTALSGLTDVSITSPATGQSLIYNGVTSKWENTTTTATSASYAATASYINPLFISASAASYGFGVGGGSTSPGGTTNQIQYNNAGNFGGVPVLLYNGSLQATGSFSGSFSGDGSRLTNLPIQSISSDSFVTTSSFNSFTSSIQTQVNNLNSSTSSFTLNSATASMLNPYVLTSVTSSMSVATASFMPARGVASSIQFNDVGITSGSSQFTYDKSNFQLNYTGALNVNGAITINGSVNANIVSGSHIGNGSGLTNITSATASYVNGIIIKNNVIAAASFTGSPRKATATFTTAYPDTNYSFTVTGEDSRAWSIESKVSGSVVINSNSNAALSGNTYWQAIGYGEFKG